MTSITVEATKPLGVKPRDAERSKNFFALGLICWMYTRPTEPLIDWIKKRFANRTEVLEANIAAFRAGFNFGETAELFDHPYEVKPAQLAAGHVPQHHRQRRAVVRARRRRAAGEAADLLRVVPDHARVRHPARAVEAQELRREDAAGRRRDRGRGRRDRRRVRGQPRRSPARAVRASTSSRRRSGSRSASSCRWCIVDVQRGGPSTGLPTKTEQADLLLAMYGRHGEAPLPIVAAQSPADCFDAAFEAVRLALKYRTPVILLTDGYLANGAEPWMLPDLDALPDISVPFATEPNHGDEFWPYLRDPETLARPWAIPGTPGLMHRIGGLEKEDGTGNISYDPENHDKMARMRAAKIAGIANDIPLVDLDDPDGAEFLRAVVGRHVGRGDRGGRAASAARGQQDRARAPAAHEPVPARPRRRRCAATRRCFVPEINLGQLSKLVRAEFLVDAQSYTRVRGVPFHAAELEAARSWR